MAVNVAILDDHRLFADALRRELTAHDEIDVVWSGGSSSELFSALIAADGVPPAVDVVLLDLDLGGQTASPELVLQIRKSGSEVLVVSALADPGVLRTLLPFGISGVVLKSESSETLAAAIKCVGSGQEWHNAEVAAALMDSPTVDFPALSDQEQRVLIMVASGLKLATVARRLDISVHTVKDYLKRIRVKHAAVGRPAPTLVDLHREAVRRGLVDP